MQQKVIVLGASPYRFQDERTRRELVGCTVHYVIAENLDPVEDKEKAVKGYKPVKGTLPYEAYEKMPEVPGVYDFTIEVKAGSDGKMNAVPTGARFVDSLTKIDFGGKPPATPKMTV